MRLTKLEFWAMNNPLRRYVQKRIEFPLFQEMGLTVATVQRQQITHEQLSTLFWINLLVTALLALGTVAAAPLVASFYGESALTPVTMALSAGCWPDN